MPRDGSLTRERILDVAERLVIDNGYAATSVDQVVLGSGTSKGSFFHHFPSKLDLARSLVERYAAADIAALDSAIAQVASIDAPGERLVAFLRLFEDTADELMSEQSSCLYVAVLAERQLAVDETSDQIRVAVVAWRQALAQLVREAGIDGIDGIDAEALADHLFVTFEGAFVLARSMGEPAHMRAQLRVLRQLVEGLVSR